MPQQIRNRNQKTVAYSAGNKVSEDLSRGMVYRELQLTLAGQLTATTANNVYANILRGDEWALVKKIEIIANGTQTIKSLSGASLRWLNFFWFGSSPQISPLLGAGGANPTFESTMILPFWMPRSVRPIDTCLDSRILSDLKVEITWGSHTDIAAAATGFTTAPTLRVDSLEAFGIDGQFAMWRLWEIEKTITATTANYQVQLPVGGMFRGFHMIATDAGVEQGDILNNMKWKSGTTVFADVKDNVLRATAAARYGLPREHNGVAYHDNFIGNNNDYEGNYHYDHVTDGMLTEAIDTAGFSEHELELDVTVGGGTTKLIIIPSQVIPIRNPGK